MTLVLYGDALYAAEQVNPAAGAYEAALAIDAELPEALLGRAEVHLRAERPGEALELLDRAKASLATRLRAPEARARMLTLFGHAYVQRAKRGDLEAARDALRQAIALSPPAEAYFWLGEAVAGKITPEAAAALKHYLELEPSGPYAARARRSLGPLL
jgi:tetratricopeptide (TPR) repeat protein